MKITSPVKGPKSDMAEYARDPKVQLVIIPSISTAPYPASCVKIIAVAVDINIEGIKPDDDFPDVTPKLIHPA